MSMWTHKLRKQLLKRLRHNSNRYSRDKLSSKMMKMTMKTRRKFQAPITQINMLTCRFQLSSEKCLNTYSVINHKRLNQTQRSNLLSQTTSLLSEKLMLSSRCQSLMDRRKISVFKFLTNLALILKTRQFQNSNMCRAKMWRVPLPLMLIRLIRLIRSRVKLPDGSAVCKISIEHDPHPQ